MKKILYICCLFLFLKCATTKQCSDTYLMPVLVGFPLTEVDTIVFRGYQPNDSFNQLVDTFLWSFTYDSLRHPDSLFVDVGRSYTSIHHFPVMYPDHDWEIYIPARDTSIYISKIVSPQTTFKCWGCECFNPIVSFMQDGVVVNPISIYDPIIFIREDL